MAKGKSYTVEIQIYSGLPNPKWKVSDPDLCDAIKKAPKKSVPPSKLGYVGFGIKKENGLCWGYITGAETVALQHQLLDSAPLDLEDLPEDVRINIKEDIDSQI